CALPISPAVWLGFRIMDAVYSGQPDRGETPGAAGRDGGWRTAREVGTDTAEAVATSLSARSGGDREVAPRTVPRHYEAGQSCRWRSLFLGRVGVSCRYRARQDLGQEGADAGG